MKEWINELRILKINMKCKLQSAYYTVSRSVLHKNMYFKRWGSYISIPIRCSFMPGCVWGTSELCLDFCAPDVAPPWRMLFCTGVIPSMGQRRYCTQQRTLRFSVGNGTKYKVQTFRVATWTSADLVLSRLNFTKLKEAPCLPIDFSLHRWVLTAQEPWVCMAHLPLGCSHRSRPATSATAWAQSLQQVVLTPFVGEQADWVANAGNSQHWSVHSSHFPA